MRDVGNGFIRSFNCQLSTIYYQLLLEEKPLWEGETGAMQGQTGGIWVETWAKL